jgi:rfaE bifunctional protein kinase chain/domain
MLSPERFRKITARYAALRIAVVGDFCLDRYLEIDPARAEMSIETGLTVHNVVRVRSQPGGAGTILNNLAALGVAKLYPVGFAGDDGEGFELRRALGERPGVDPAHFVTTGLRRTFTYCKPLVMAPGCEPVELNRLDSKNWSPTPGEVEDAIIAGVRTLANRIDALILLDQVDEPETGVVTRRVLEAVAELSASTGFIIADSRRSLAEYPPLAFKMNAAELARMQAAGVAATGLDDLGAVRRATADLAARTGRPVFVTLAERGIVGAMCGASGRLVVEHAAAHPVRGPIDVVGAGDSVTANLTAAVAAGAELDEALRLAMAAAAIVVHQLGTTGTATVAQLAEALGSG